ARGRQPPPPASAGQPGELRPPAHRVSPRAKGWWALRAAIPWCIVLVVLTGAAVAAPPTRLFSPLVALVVIACAAVHLAVMPRWRYAFHRWEVNPVAIYAQTGWLTRERVLIPLSRIQVVDTKADVLERAFGLATLTVTTASSAGTVHVPGLPVALAESVAAGIVADVGTEDDDAT
ncbi:PH domain-containing protein, partial [Tsukamurella sp. 8J]|uniref:PH domain-containing protein n=1 Tax=Tsukamurella sp. 8J TaxID=3031962 RepID=UPI0031BAFAC7